MRSIMAALRTLTLPFGATTGERIVLNAETGVISIYDATNTEVIRISSDDLTGFQSIGTTDTVQIALGQLTIFSNSVPDLSVAEYAKDRISYQSADGTKNMLMQFGGNAGNYMLITGVWQSDDPNNAFVKETWHDVALQNGWTNNGGGYPNLRYREIPDGFVGIEGTIKPGVTANGTLIGTLAAGYRPATIKRIPFIEAGIIGFVDVQTNGQMLIYGSAGVVTASFETQFPLGSID